MTDPRDVRALAERLAALAANATPGPWTTDTDANDQQMILAVDADFWVALCPHQCLRSIEVQAEKNAAYIAATNPEAVAALIEWGLAADTRATEAERDNADSRALVVHLQSELAAEVGALKRAEQRAGQLERERETLGHDLDDAMGALREAKQRIATLTAALDKFGRHANGCRSQWRAATGSSDIGPCDCGFDAALTGEPEAGQ